MGVGNEEEESILKLIFRFIWHCRLQLKLGEVSDRNANNKSIMHEPMRVCFFFKKQKNKRINFEETYQERIKRILQSNGNDGGGLNGNGGGGGVKDDSKHSCFSVWHQ